VFQLLSQTIYTHAVEREDLEVVLPRVPNPESRTQSPEPRTPAKSHFSTQNFARGREDGGWRMEYGIWEYRKCEMGNGAWERAAGNPIRAANAKRVVAMS